MSDTTVLYTIDTVDCGAVRLARWPEGLVLWVGGQIRWKSWQDKRDKLVELEHQLAEAMGPAGLERALEAWHRPLEWWTRKGSDPLRNHRERMAEAIRAALAQTGEGGT